MTGRKLSVIVVALVMYAVLAVPAGARAAFGVQPGTLVATATNGDGSIDLRAGSHPANYTVSFVMNQDGEGFPEGTLRALEVDLPPGFVGDPQAVPECPRSAFEGSGSLCPGNSQVGVAILNIKGIGTTAETWPIYHLSAPTGTAASFGFQVTGYNSFQEASVRTGGDYGVTVADLTIPTALEIQSVSETFWGVPADPSHDAQRHCIIPNSSSSTGYEPIVGCASDVTPAPFLTMPTSCSGPLHTTIRVSSTAGQVDSESVESLAESGLPTGLNTCERPPFDPAISVKPETAASDSPTGLHVTVHVPQGNSAEAKLPETILGSLATAHLRDGVFDLPSGLAVNPSAADGLAACTLAQIDLPSSAPPRCPESSKLGTVEIHTPLLDHPLPGAIYLASQGQNPFGSLLALYIAVDDPVSGIVVKLPGRVDPDPVTGKLRTTFANNPQLPFEDLEVEFYGGPRAPLTTPSICGTYTTTSTLTPWTAPEGAYVSPSDAFQVTAGPKGGSCAAAESQMPNSLSFEAGTQNPFAGAYSAFVLKLTREPGSQRLTGLNVRLPMGLTGRIAGTAECSDAQIAQAEARRNPGEGALEQAAPSCPASSEVGVITVGAGSGSPLYVHGRAYLAGPYKGAPLSLVLITPAVAGPFDLGTVVVRSALYVNEETGQITVKSDSIPTILQGIPLDVRSIAVHVSKNQFTLNPTNCEASSLDAEVATSAGSVAHLENRFQVGGCAGLEFHPRLKLELKGATKRAGHPKLKAVVSFPHKVEEANAASIQVGLPHALFLDQGNLNKVCTRPELASRNCPSTSVYGHVKAYTPLFDEPLTGPVYLGVGFGYKLPALVTELNGKVRILAHGRVDTTKQNGLRNTFEFLPDAPISRIVLEMKGGKKYGLLENSENLCAKTRRANARFVAHNGQVAQMHPSITDSCKKRKGGGGRRR